MSIRAMDWALGQKCPSPVSKLVLITLANYANQDGECWPSQARIAADCGVTRPHVCAQVKLLEKLGLIENKTRINDKGQQTNLYFLRCQPADREGVSPLTDPVSGVYTEPFSEPLDTLEPSGSNGADAPPPTPIDPVKDLWDRGLAILGEGQRSLLGKMRKRYKDPAVLEAIVACEQEHPSDPPAFFVRCCEAKARDAPGNYHETPLGNLWKGAHRAAEAIIARQNQGNLGNRDAPAFPLLDGGRTRSGPPDAA